MSLVGNVEGTSQYKFVCIFGYYKLTFTFFKYEEILKYFYMQDYYYL